MSVGLIGLTLYNLDKPEDIMAASAWYDAHAERIADAYESLDASQAHPDLFQYLMSSEGLRILDVGAGTGRDAAAMAALGHSVLAVDPSDRMLTLAKTLHLHAKVRWVNDQLPLLEATSGTFDVILLSAVWTHINPEDRKSAFHRLVSLLAPGGTIYATLRTGPDDLERGMFAVKPGELKSLAAENSLEYDELSTGPDLLGRENISWQTVRIQSRDAPE